MLIPSLVKSSIGKKSVMGATGLLLVGFVIMHLLGNLLIYFGPEALNAYAEKLRRLGPLLWVARVTLFAAVVVHIILSILLTRENRQARPLGYAMKPSLHTTYAARSMMLSGVILLAFIVYHLLQFTFRMTNPSISNLTDALGRHDVYAMVVLSFSNRYIASVYVIAMGLLCLHLSHGIGSFCQSLGLTNEQTIPLLERLGCLIAIALFVGYASIPLSVYFGLVKLP